MDVVQSIAMRRAILDWRDKWLSEIPKHLERELPELYDLLARAIDRIGGTQLFNSQKFFAKNVEPVLQAWIGNQTRLLMRKASKELQCANEVVLRADLETLKARHSGTSDYDSYWGVMTGILSTGSAVAAVPTVVSLSVSTTGGILAALGFGTTLVVHWPVALVGAVAVGTLMLFGKNRAFGIKDRKTRKLKDEVQAKARELIFGNRGQQESLVSKLQDAIRATANALLASLPNA